jgi:hypothetical protein
MVKLGEGIVNEHVSDIMGDLSSEEDDMQTCQESREDQTSKEEESDYIDLPKKKKRGLTDKQRAALERGRAKKLKMNLQAKIKKYEETNQKLEEIKPLPEQQPEGEPSTETNDATIEKLKTFPPEPPKLKRTQRIMPQETKKRRKRPAPKKPASDSEIETDEEIEKSKEKNISRIIDKYLESHMKKQAAKERNKKIRKAEPSDDEEEDNENVRYFNCRFL